MLDRVPRQPLGFWPTPLHALDRLSAHLGGPRLLIKRDDQTGLAFGGNKTRKLEYLVADALARGCDTLITAGAAQSNHCRQTAAAAARCGLACHLLLGGSASASANGNLLLDHLLGAEVHWTGDERRGESLSRVEAAVAAGGSKPYVVPYGGSNEVGALGFVHAVGELAAQLRETATSVTHVVFATSSGGTHAGLLVGSRLYGLTARVVGIGIDKDARGATALEAGIRDIAGRAAQCLGRTDAFTPTDIDVRHEYAEAGYGVVGEAEREAIHLLARTEGILLDPVYTGRAMAGLLDLVRNGQLDADDTVLFWHTGGAPALFAYADALGQA